MEEKRRMESDRDFEKRRFNLEISFPRPVFLPNGLEYHGMIHSTKMIAVKKEGHSRDDLVFSSVWSHETQQAIFRSGTAHSSGRDAHSMRCDAHLVNALICFMDNDSLLIIKMLN